MAPVVAGSIQDYFPFAAPGVWALGTLMGWTLNVASHEAEKLGLESDNRDIRHFMDSEPEADGGDSAEAPAEEPPDRFEYDPADPVPTIGGRGLLPVAAGVFDHSELEQRRDILVYSTSPLTEDVEVTGPVVLNLWAATSAVDTDFTARLLDVFPDGVAYNLTEGMTRLRFRPDKPGLVVPGEVERVEITLAPTSNLFRKGHRIRLEVSSSNFPFADPNPNTGKCLLTDPANETKVAQQTVFHDSRKPSHLVLPVIPAS